MRCYPNKFQSQTLKRQTNKNGGIYNSARLKKQLQRLADALSGFDDALEDAQKYSVPTPNMLDIQRRRLLTGIDNDLSDVSRSVCGVGEKIEQLKTSESIL